jgi:hypothetical protein
MPQKRKVKSTALPGQLASCRKLHREKQWRFGTMRATASAIVPSAMWVAYSKEARHLFASVFLFCKSTHIFTRLFLTTHMKNLCTSAAGKGKERELLLLLLL